jgi:hypothetical protein
MGNPLTRLTRLSVSAALLMVAAGCGYKPDLPPTAEVSGSVTLDGQPLPGAMIQFVPDPQKGTKGAAGVAASDEKGHYEVTTAGVKGALVGSHKIAVEARKRPKDGTDTLPPSLIPTRYNNPSTSGLATEVKKDQKNVVDLPLRSKQ